MHHDDPDNENRSIPRLLDSTMGPRTRTPIGGGRSVATVIEWNGVAGVRVTRIDSPRSPGGVQSPSVRERCVGIVCEPMN